MADVENLEEGKKGERCVPNTQAIAVERERQSGIPFRGVN